MQRVWALDWLVICGSLVCGIGAAVADESYTVYRAGVPMAIDGRLDETAWLAAPDLGGFVFPWWEAGEREQTVAKLLWDNEHLYAAFLCEDAHIWAEHTQRDSAVFRDDCVEIFTAPNLERPDAYFNIEMNVLGIALDQWHPEGPGKPVPGEWNGEGFRIATSINGTLNDEEDTDQYWILEAAIPLANFAVAGVRIPPQPGDIWHLNLNRCGGRTNEQFSQWRASRTAHPNFHRPGDFGRVGFSSSSSPFR